jgi:hypothetical protein
MRLRMTETPLCWDRPYPSEPNLEEEWGSTDRQQVLYFQELAHSPQFGRFWDHLELELGKVVPELELVDRGLFVLRRRYVSQ